MYDETWGGLPDKDFLIELHPKLSELRDPSMIKLQFGSSFRSFER